MASDQLTRRNVGKKRARLTSPLPLVRILGQLTASFWMVLANLGQGSTALEYRVNSDDDEEKDQTRPSGQHLYLRLTSPPHYVDLATPEIVP